MTTTYVKSCYVVLVGDCDKLNYEYENIDIKSPSILGIFTEKSKALEVYNKFDGRKNKVIIISCDLEDVQDSSNDILRYEDNQCEYQIEEENALKFVIGYIIFTFLSFFLYLTYILDYNLCDDPTFF